MCISISMLVPKIRTKGYGGRKFSYATSTLWNYLYSSDLEKSRDSLWFQEWIENLFFYTVLPQEVTLSTFSMYCE